MHYRSGHRSALRCGLLAALTVAVAGTSLAAGGTGPGASAMLSMSRQQSPGGCPPGCIHAASVAAHLGDTPMMRAIDRIADAGQGGRDRYRLLASVQQSPTCYAPDLTQEQWEEILRTTGALPPALLAEPDDLRFFTSNTVWTGNGGQGPSGQARFAQLTYSFPADGTAWGSSGLPTGPNVLNAMFSSMFGSANIDRGREYVRQGLAAWGRDSGTRYAEVADDNAAMTTATARVATRGDVRIGGILMGVNGILAYNNFPTSGSDMAINTSYQGSYAAVASNFRFLRNVVTHEHGHGLGYIHTVPCNQVFLMEPSITVNFDMLTVDEKRGAQRNYGDRYAGNHVASVAVDFGDLTTPALRSVIERDLSINGASGPVNTNQDWFRFSLSSAQPVVITVAPTGGVYVQGQQTGGCSGSTATVNASQAGNLNIELRDSTGTTVLQTAASAGAGGTETLNAGTLAAGTYTVRVYDVGPNPTANQTVQLYDMTIRVASALAPPQAVAGINKRCAANSNCYFMGNINSRALEPGATIPTSGYAWDLEGDGVFSLTGGMVSRQYPSNGVYPVTLRVTDSNGQQATHTITVTVTGATMTITGVSPNVGTAGETIPVTITGTNLKNVTNASMVTVSGTGVTVTGTPAPDQLGTSVTGLNFVIDAGAEPGPRNIIVANADGTATGFNLFLVEAGSGGCPADWNGDEQVNSQDISAFISDWLASVQNGTLVADFNDDGVVNSSDISAFITAWLAAIAGGC